MSRLIRASIFALLIVAPAASVRAELAIVASNLTLAPGGVGTMNFTVTSNSGDQLMDFGLGLQIKKVGSPTSLIQFTSSQPDPYGNANYVFAGESSGADASLPFWGAPQEKAFPSDMITGGDTDDGSTAGYVTIPSTPGGLHTFLASVQFSAPKGATAGDRFQVVLLTDSGLTYFDTPNGTLLSYSIQAGGGLVTIASVPEPSSALTGLIGATFLGAAEGFRRRRSGRRLARRPRSDRS